MGLGHHRNSRGAEPKSGRPFKKLLPQPGPDHMSQFETVASVGDIADGQGATFTVGDQMIAVFRSDGRYFAIDDLCPHMGASLGTGHLEEGVVTCPWHAWRFKVCDGTWVDNPKLKVGCYEVRVEGNEIQVCVPAK